MSEPAEAFKLQPAFVQRRHPALRLSPIGWQSMTIVHVDTVGFVNQWSTSALVHPFQGPDTRIGLFINFQRKKCEFDDCPHVQNSSSDHLLHLSFM